MKNKFKHITIIVTSLILTLCLAIGVWANTGKVTKTLSYSNIKITLNGEEIEPKDAKGNVVEPFAIDGTTYLPIRAIANALDLDVKWNGSTNTVVINQKNTTNTPGSIDSGIDYSSRISVVNEYSMNNSIGDSYYVVLVKNNSSTTLQVSSNALARDASGNIIGSANASESAVGGGETVVLLHYFDDVDAKKATYEHTLSVKQESYNKSTYEDLSFEKSISGKKAIVLVTNNGNEAAKFVKARALFFKGGNLVYTDERYTVDADSELKPGATLSTELEAYQEFDTVEIFVHGRR